MIRNDMPIRDFNGEFSFLSTFYLAPIEFEGLIYPCAECAFHATRSENKWDRIPFTKCTSSQIAELVGRVKTRRGWDLMKLSYMESVLMTKFARADLKFRLQSTGNVEIVALSKVFGPYWGRGPNGTGNHLGKILMLVRDKIAPNHNERVRAPSTNGDMLSRSRPILTYPTSALSGLANEELLGSLGFKFDPSERSRRVLVIGEWILSNKMRVIASITVPEMVLAWITTSCRSLVEIRELVEKRLGELRGLLPPGINPPHLRMSRRGVQVQGKFAQYIWEDLGRYGAHVDNVNLTHSELEFLLITNGSKCELYHPSADTLVEMSKSTSSRLSGRNTLYIYKSYGTAFSKIAICATCRLQYTGTVADAGPVMLRLRQILYNIMNSDRATWFLATLRRVF